MALSDYQSQDTIQQSKRGSSAGDRSYGSTAAVEDSSNNIVLSPVMLGTILTGTVLLVAVFTYLLVHRFNKRLRRA